MDEFISGGGIYKFPHKGEQNYEEFVFEPTMFNYTYKINKTDKTDDLINKTDDLNDNNLIYKEFNFGTHRDKIILLMDKTWDTSNDMIYYYRLIDNTLFYLLFLEKMFLR